MGDDNNSHIEKRRWLILTAASFSNFSNITLWVSFQPITKEASQFYGVAEYTINWFSIVFFLATVLLGVVAMWVLDKKGLQFGMQTGVWISILGCLLRTFSSFTVFSSNSFIIALVGQCIVGCSQPFLFFTPTKISQTWFPKNERAIATSITLIGCILGFIFVYAVSSILLSFYGIKWLNLLWCVPSFISVCFTNVALRAWKPEVPPSTSALVITTGPFFHSLKQMALNLAFFHLLVAVGCVVATYSIILVYTREVLCVKGYSRRFSLICLFLITGCSIVGGLVVAALIDAKRKHILTSKICIALYAISVCFWGMVINYSHLHYPIGLAYILLGFFSLPVVIVGLELGVECLFPFVAEATTTGFILMIGMLQALLYMILVNVLKRPLTPLEINHEKCTNDSLSSVVSVGIENGDMRDSIFFLEAVIVAASIIYILFFNGECKRLKTEAIADLRRNLLTSSQGSEHYASESWSQRSEILA